MHHSNQTDPVHSNRMRLSYPSSWWKNSWREALPAGNGKLGASVQGGVSQEIILLNHHELWHWGKRDELPDVSHTLASTRRMMDRKQYQEASWNLTRTLKETGYDTRLSCRFPLGAVVLHQQTDQPFRHYQRELDMETGEISVSWHEGEEKCERRLFVSRADDCVVYELSGGASKSGKISLQLYPDERRVQDPEYHRLQDTIEIKVDPQHNLIYYAGRNDDGQDFGAVLYLIPLSHSCADANGISSNNDVPEQDNAGPDIPVHFEELDSNPSSENGLSFSHPSGRILIITSVFVGGQREEEWQRLRKQLQQLPADYNMLQKRHVLLHRPLFLSARLELSGRREQDQKTNATNHTDTLDKHSTYICTNEELLLDAYKGEASLELIRRMWAYGRYVFISGTGPSSQPFGLYGLWNGDYRPIWSHNMANENIQMIYWHAGVGGLSDFMPSLFDYYDSLMEDFRQNARRLYGCRGIYIPAGTTPGIGVPNQVVPVIMNWTGAASWLARFYYDHYRFTGDERFLHEKALPFMKEALLFYEDFLVEDELGQYRIYPSVSPENTPQNFMPPDGIQLDHPMPTAINATMDIALIQELLTHLLELGSIAGAEQDQMNHWQHMRERLPAYKQNDEWAIREWQHTDFDDRYEHRHLSHLYPVFPGKEVKHTDHPQFDGFKRAVEHRKIGAQTGWSLAHMAATYARLEDGEQALDSLNALARSCLLSNGFTLHNDWRQMGICLDMPAAPVQLDACMGWVNAVQEMLLYVSGDLIKLLPALPHSWGKGHIADWCIYGGSITMTWDQDTHVFKAKIQMNRSCQLQLKLPSFVHEFVLEGEGYHQQCHTFAERMPNDLPSIKNTNNGTHCNLVFNAGAIMHLKSVVQI